MAYNLRLYSEFLDQDGNGWRVNIYQDGYIGSTYTFNLGGEGFVLSYEGDNQSRYQPIIGSSVDIPFTETTSDHSTFIEALATSAEGEFTVAIIKDPDGANTLYWGGVLQPDQCIIQDEYFPVRTTLRAVDDLGNLKNVLYNNGGTGYGLASPSTVVDHLILGLSWVRQSHLWGTSTVMLKYVDDFRSDDHVAASNFLYNTKVLHNSFYNPDEDGVNQFLSIYTVLESFATAFNARIFQANGTFWFIPVGAYQYSTTLNYFTCTKGGTVSGSSTALNTVLTLGTNVIKMAGYEHSFLPPLLRVERPQNYSGNVPRVFANVYEKSDFGTALEDADFDYAANSVFRLSGTAYITQPGDGTTTGNARVGRFLLRFTLKVGNYYLRRTATFAGVQNLFQMQAGSVLSYEPHTYNTTTWSLTAGPFEIVTDVYDINEGCTGEGALVVAMDIVTPPLTAQSNSIELTGAIQNVSYQGNLSNVTNVDTNYRVQLLRVDQIEADTTNGDEVTFSAHGLSSSRVVYEQPKVYVGDAVAQNSKGVLKIVDGGQLLDSTGWTSLNYTGTGIGIHLLGVREVLAGQRLHTRVQRGELYKGPVEMYHTIYDGERYFLPFQLSLEANSRTTTVEAFYVNRDVTGITDTTSDTEDVRGPVNGFPSSPSNGFTQGIQEAANNAGQIGADFADLDATVTGIGTRVDLLYDTFQPKGVDYAKTVITYESNKTDGTALELDQTSAQLVSASGNSLMAISEASPGEFRIDLQDDTTPTPLSINVAFATADKTKAGLFGLGTEAPEERLHVVGNAKVDGNIIVTGSVDGVDISTLDTIATKDIPVYNNTASTITKGTIVRENGAQSATGELRIAAFNSLLTVDAHRILGVMTEDIAAGASGYARAVGHVRGLNTNSFTVGTLLYASATTAGAWTSALPTAFNSYAQIIGWVTKQNATTGEIFVRIVPATTLENLANVKDQPPSVGQVLVYDGSVWAGTTQATYSSIGIPGATPPAGGFKSVWFQDSAGNMTYDEAFTYDTSTNTLEIDGTATTAGVLRLGEATNNGTNYVGIQAPATLAANTTYTLPSADGTSGQVLSTNGSGTLSFVTRKATQVTGKTVATGAWSLVSGFYEASISDAAISATSIVDVIPDNASAATAATAGVLPRTDSSSGAVKIYATTTPAATLTVTLNIFDL